MRPVLGFSGEKLLALRVERRLTQQQLSDKTTHVVDERGAGRVTGRRIHRDTISRYETGEAKPSPLNFGVLAFALGCDQSDLLDEAEAGAA